MIWWRFPCILSDEEKQNKRKKSFIGLVKKNGEEQRGTVFETWGNTCPGETNQRNRKKTIAKVDSGNGNAWA